MIDYIILQTKHSSSLARGAPHSPDEPHIHVSVSRKKKINAILYYLLVVLCSLTLFSRDSVYISVVTWTFVFYLIELIEQ